MSFPRFTAQLAKESVPYSGHELRPHFLLERFGVKGSALVAFQGSCRVATSELVDWEDKLAQDRIEARSMVHFIGELFGLTLREGVLLQRLAMAILRDETDALSKHRLRRDGDDLFALERKLSVSIVTASPVSVLLHIGINIDPSGAPVPAIGLTELGIEWEAWAKRALERIAAEWESMDWACAKVRPVI